MALGATFENELKRPVHRWEKNKNAAKMVAQTRYLLHS
jgi:hypothetical protein